MAMVATAVLSIICNVDLKSGITESVWSDFIYLLTLKVIKQKIAYGWINWHCHQKTEEEYYLRRSRSLRGCIQAFPE